MTEIFKKGNSLLKHAGKGIILMLLVMMLVYSCKKTNVLSGSDATLTVSADSLFFDTVFTSTGSVTKALKIINTNDGVIKISSIDLSGGSRSPFQLNINGISDPTVENISLQPQDSIYVFVRINIDATSENLPFIVSDSIAIRYNGVEQLVQLRAYGQNAVFLKNRIVTDNETWSSTLPYVIVDRLIVDTNATLTLTPGTRIFVNAIAPILVHGTIKAGGSYENPVVFTGDRLDEEYKNLPASWPGIVFEPASTNNTLEHAIIKNGFRGIVSYGFKNSGTPKIILSKCIIENIYDAGIFAINSEINADNCLILNCGQNISLYNGGNYRFTHCTVATFGNNYIDHKNPVLFASNGMQADGELHTANLNASFTNSIFWGENGNVNDEILLQKHESAAFDVTFDHVLFKATETPLPGTFVNSRLNVDPQFDSINISKRIFDLRFTKSTSAPAINAGKTTAYQYDLTGKLRDDKPDLGCFER